MSSCLPKWVKVRHLQMSMLFFSLAVSYMMRVNLSLGIVLMTDLNSTSDNKVFNWTVGEQSTSQSVFFLGYFALNLVASVLVTRFSNKLLLLGTISTSSLVTMLLPTLVTYGDYPALIATRLILGVAQGGVMACTMGLMSRWIPPAERARCGALVLGGIHFGNLVSFSLSGWMGDHYGWPSIFYFAGAAGIIWSIFWMFIGADSVESCSYISKEEKVYVDSQLAETSSLPKSVPVPWKRMFLSKACWGILLATIGQGWGYWTLVTEIPTYFDAVEKFSVGVNGVITALPFACMLVVSAPMSFLSDYLIRKKILSITASRKINNTIAHWGAAVCLIVLGLTHEKSVVIAMYVLGVSLLSFAYIGHNINHLDIVPNFAGFLMGITNGLANISSFGGPFFVGFVVHEKDNTSEWQIVFFVAAAVFFTGNLAFLIMGTGKELEFNRIPEDYGTNSKSVTREVSVVYSCPPDVKEKAAKEYVS